MVNNERRSKILVYGLPGGTLRSLYLVSYVSSSVCFNCIWIRGNESGLVKGLVCLAQRDGGFSSAVCR